MKECTATGAFYVFVSVYMGQEQSMLAESLGTQPEINVLRTHSSNSSQAPLPHNSEDEEPIDIYDTSVNRQLLKLLASINEEPPVDSRAASLSAAASEFVPGKLFDSSRPVSRASDDKWNASAPEFVPGKLSLTSTPTQSASEPSSAVRKK